MLGVCIIPTDFEKLAYYEKIKEIVETKKISWFDAILWHCEDTELEVEVAATLISPKLKELIEEDVSKLHMLTKALAKLPGI